MRKLSPLLAVTAICGMAALPQTSSADAVVRPDTRAEDFSYYGGGYYAYDDYYAGPYHPAAPYYDDGYYYPPAYHARPYPVPIPVPFGLGLGFGFGHGHWGGDD